MSGLVTVLYRQLPDSAQLRDADAAALVKHAPAIGATAPVERDSSLQSTVWRGAAAALASRAAARTAAADGSLLSALAARLHSRATALCRTALQHWALAVAGRAGDALSSCASAWSAHEAGCRFYLGALARALPAAGPQPAAAVQSVLRALAAVAALRVVASAGRAGVDALRRRNTAAAQPDSAAAADALAAVDRIAAAPALAKGLAAATAALGRHLQGYEQATVAAALRDAASQARAASTGDSAPAGVSVANLAARPDAFLPPLAAACLVDAAARCAPSAAPVDGAALAEAMGALAVATQGGKASLAGVTGACGFVLQCACRAAHARVAGQDSAAAAAAAAVEVVQPWSAPAKREEGDGASPTAVAVAAAAARALTQRAPSGLATALGRMPPAVAWPALAAAVAAPSSIPGRRVAIRSTVARLCGSEGGAGAGTSPHTMARSAAVSMLPQSRGEGGGEGAAGVTVAACALLAEAAATKGQRGGVGLVVLAARLLRAVFAQAVLGGHGAPPLPHPAASVLLDTAWGQCAPPAGIAHAEVAALGATARAAGAAAWADVAEQCVPRKEGRRQSVAVGPLLQGIGREVAEALYQSVAAATAPNGNGEEAVSRAEAAVSRHLVAIVAYSS